MKPVSPGAADGDLLTLSITADGKPLDSNLQVIGVEVWSGVNAVPKAKVVLLGGTHTPPDEPFVPEDFEALQPGKAIEIRAGYGDTTDAIFSGIVVIHGIELAGDPPARVVVDAAGQAVTMTTPDPSQVAVLRVAYGESMFAFKAEIDLGRSRMAGPRGEVSFSGSAMARPGSLIELEGVGGRFNDAVLISAVHHQIAQGEWTTGVEFGHVPEPLEPTSAPAPAASPDGVDRIDGIVTPSKLEVHFDDTNRVITIRTPRQLVISLNDTSGEIHIADANQNSVTLGSSGIRIASTSNLAITAAGQIEVKAGAGLALHAAGDLSCHGLDVDFQADTAFRAHGGATADLASAGVVTVHGALVKIN